MELPCILNLHFAVKKNIKIRQKISLVNTLCSLETYQNMYDALMITSWTAEFAAANKEWFFHFFFFQDVSKKWSRDSREHWKKLYLKYLWAVMTFVDDEQSGHFYLHSTLVPLFCMMYDYMFFQVAWIEVDFYQLLCIFSLLGRALLAGILFTKRNDNKGWSQVIFQEVDELVSPHMMINFNTFKNHLIHLFIDVDFESNMNLNHHTWHKAFLRRLLLKTERARKLGCLQ